MQNSDLFYQLKAIFRKLKVMIQKRVLLAEDDQDDRMIFEEFLEDRKDFLLVSAVENGVEIFEFLNNLESESLLPQLIILDKNMPKINGVEALKLIKSEERFRNISVVIYSTYIDQNLINTCKALGAAAILPKPFTKKGYNEMMDEFLRTTKDFI